MAVPHGVVQFEKRYARQDGGGEVWALVSVSLMREMEVPSCYLYQVHDITEQRKAAERLAELAAERMKRQASELADASKTEFLSRASHEMRTPLNAVIGFAQLIEHQQELDRSRTGTYAHHIREAGEHLLLLVTDLLDLNRAAQGRMKMSPQPLKVAEAVGEALHLLETLAQSHGIELHAAVPDELTVLADPLRLRQVLLNLGSNAIKYNRQGGRVGFRAAEAGAQAVQLLIEDTGIGMTAEQLDRLFQPFERLGQERTKIPGVGLGLVITRGLVVEMGGALNVTSEPRAGTTIRIELPAAPSSPFACGPQATTQGNE
jgi:signal transduction histidine kinase